MLSDMSMSQLMRRMDYKAKDGRTCVPHGLRSTFRDWAAETTTGAFQTAKSTSTLLFNLHNQLEVIAGMADISEQANWLARQAMKGAVA